METTKSQQAGERTQFSPGPWKTNENAAGDIWIQAGAGFIAEITPAYGTLPPRLAATRKANANLITAAPDLLESLDAMLEFIDQYATLTDCNGRNLEEDFSDFRKAAMKAIRKANGAGQ